MDLGEILRVIEVPVALPAETAPAALPAERPEAPVPAPAPELAPVETASRSRLPARTRAGEEATCAR